MLLISHMPFFFVANVSFGLIFHWLERKINVVWGKTMLYDGNLLSVVEGMEKDQPIRTTVPGDSSHLEDQPIRTTVPGDSRHLGPKPQNTAGDSAMQL